MIQLSSKLCMAACAALISVSLTPAADAQRRGGTRPGAHGGGQRINMNASNRAGRGQAHQHHQVRREANRTINYNRNVHRNVHRDLNVDVDVHHEYGYGYNYRHHYHPIARAAAVATTAAVIGSYYRSLPSNCVVIYRGSLTYYQCGNAWYQPYYSGTTIQYVVVQAP